MNNSIKKLLLLSLGIVISAFSYAGNTKRKIPVSSTPSPGSLPESERVPPRFFCPFDVYYSSDTREIEIQILDEVDYVSYRIESSDGVLFESDSLGVTPEGVTFYFSISSTTTETCELLLYCNYGEYTAVFEDL